MENEIRALWNNLYYLTAKVNSEIAKLREEIMFLRQKMDRLDSEICEIWSWISDHEEGIE